MDPVLIEDNGQCHVAAAGPIVPGKQPSTSAVEAAELWAGLEEQADVAKAVIEDEQERLMDVT